MEWRCRFALVVLSLAVSVYMTFTMSRIDYFIQRTGAMYSVQGNESGSDTAYSPADEGAPNQQRIVAADEGAPNQQRIVDGNAAMSRNDYLILHTGAKYAVQGNEAGSVSFKQKMQRLDRSEFVCHPIIWREPAECNHSSAYWTASQMKAESGEFLMTFNNRKLDRNVGGVNINHAFALWFTIRMLRPRPMHIIESGVARGGSTYFLRQAAGPDAYIYSVDPGYESQLEYRDASPRTRYFMGDDFLDFGDMDWDSLIPMNERRHALIFFDDHRPIVGRVQMARGKGFGHIVFDDNLGAKPNMPHVLDTMSGTCMPGGTRYVLQKKKKSISEVRAMRSIIKESVEVYFEFPPLLDRCAKDERQVYRSEQELVAAGFPAFAKYPNYMTVHPAYMKLRQEGAA